MLTPRQHRASVDGSVVVKFDFAEIALVKDLEKAAEAGYGVSKKDLDTSDGVYVTGNLLSIDFGEVIPNFRAKQAMAVFEDNITAPIFAIETLPARIAIWGFRTEEARRELDMRAARIINAVTTEEELLDIIIRKPEIWLAYQNPVTNVWMETLGEVRNFLKRIEQRERVRTL